MLLIVTDTRWAECLDGEAPELIAGGGVRCPKRRVAVVLGVWGGVQKRDDGGLRQAGDCMCLRSEVAVKKSVAFRPMRGLCDGAFYSTKGEVHSPSHE